MCSFLSATAPPTGQSEEEPGSECLGHSPVGPPLTIHTMTMVTAGLLLYGLVITRQLLLVDTRMKREGGPHGQNGELS